MELVSQRCCGIDSQKKVIVACVMSLTAARQRHQEIRSFRTVTTEVLERCD
jgi:hypothetical protein